MMGAFSEMDIELRYGDGDDSIGDEDTIPAFAEDTLVAPAGAPPAPVADVSQPPQESTSPTAPAQDDKSIQSETQTAAGKAAANEESEEAKRKAHEEAEAKRKAEWEERQAQKKATEQEQLDHLAAMSDDEVMSASMKRVNTDIEKLTRRNMKECVAEYIQTMCIGNPAFARHVMHPGKSMIHCIWYINRKAREFVEQEMKDNDIKPENGVYGSDIPDDLCYQWAVDYFNDPDAEEDHRDEEKFVPRPYTGKTTAAKGKSKAKNKKAAAKSPKQDSSSDQMSLLGMAS